jgi:hypothetical protein
MLTHALFAQRGVAMTPDKQEITMHHTLIAAALFGALSLPTAAVSYAQEWNTKEWNYENASSSQPPSEDVQGQPTGEESEKLEGQNRSWVWYSQYCWSRWAYVGYNWWGRPVYRRYVSCR